MSELTRMSDLRPHRELLESAAASQVADLVVDLDDVMARARGRRVRRCHARRLSAVLLVAAAFGVFLLLTVMDTAKEPPVSQVDGVTAPGVVVWETGSDRETMATPLPWNDTP